MKYVSIFSVTLKSAITPSFMGLMATTLPGVRPSISFASFPTATTSPLFLLIATIEGSLTTMPLPLANTSVFAVPRSMARSEERRLKTDLIEYPFFMNPLLPCVPRPQISVSAVPFHSSKMLRNHDGHALDGCAASAILSRDHDLVRAAGHGLREVAEFPVRANVGHCLAVNNQRGARFRVANHFHHFAIKLDVIHFKQHTLLFSLVDQREFRRGGGLARGSLCIDCLHSPEIIARA